MPQVTERRAIAYGFYPFWFWNGELTESEIRWQIEEMADQGIRGFFIHPRQGLRQPYLSEAFFHMIRIAIQAAEAHGLVVHLYDEYPYPSGTAGGAVTLGTPQFYATRLVQQAFDVPGGPVRRALPRGKVLSCMAYPLDKGQVDWSQGTDLLPTVGVALADNSYNETGLTRYNQKRYFASNPTPILETGVLHDPHRVFVSVQAVEEHHKYWGHSVDVLNPDAVRRFIRLTHERYWNQIGDRFGTSIHSIFTDETAPGWSERIPRAFEAEYGYDLLPLLPALQDKTHPRHLEVAFDLDRLVYRLFCQSFEEQISGWCREHNLRYAGEKDSQRLGQLKYMDIPGCEPGHTKAGAPMDLLRPRIRQNARATASAAYFYGKEGALCECLHSLGWGGTLQDAKVISEGLMLMGIRYLVLHGMFYTTHALTKHDAPPSWFFQMPYWPLFGALSRRLDRIAHHFEGTRMDANVLVVDPSSGLPSRTDLKNYERVLNVLVGEHIDFLIVDTDILESGSVRGGQIHARDISANTVLLPHMQVVERPLEAWLSAFEKAGGKVIRLEESFERERCVHLLIEDAQPLLEVRPIQGDTGRLHMVTRTDGDRYMWFILNTSGEELQVEFRARSELKEIALDDGTPCTLIQTNGVYTRTIYPFESLLMEATESAPTDTMTPRVTLSVNPPLRIIPQNKNLVRLYNWQMELLDEEEHILHKATVPAIPLPNQLMHGKFRFAPQVDLFFGATPELKLPMIRANYRFQFDNRFSGKIELVMEPGSIVGDWTIKVNDAHPITEPDFGDTDAHVRGSLAADITPALKQGLNAITVSLRTDRIDGGLVNPLYLAGDFGVELDPVRLVEFNPDGEYETWRKNGLPHYAGIVEYETAFHMGELADAERVLVELDHGTPFQDAVEISVNGSPWHAMPWSPYCALLPSSQFKEGSNVLKVRVYTTLIRSIEGQWFDIEHHCYREVEEEGLSDR
jgi:hypothetical protein